VCKEIGYSMDLTEYIKLIKPELTVEERKTFYADYGVSLKCMSCNEGLIMNEIGACVSCGSKCMTCI
jgi:hypothetical protein